MKKALTIWRRFCLLAQEEARINAIPAIGKEDSRFAPRVNVFNNEGTRRARALQLLNDLQKELQRIGMSKDEFLTIVNG